jgi:sigma-B regulation protein RsbU (phosphoserine phosphatase)
MIDNMPTAGTHCVIVTSKEPRVLRALAALGPEVLIRQIDLAGMQQETGEFEAADAILVEGLNDPAGIADACRTLAAANAAAPILAIADAQSLLTESAALDAGADRLIHLSDDAESERRLAANVRALLRRKKCYNSLREQCNAVRRDNLRLALATRQLDEELDLAGKIQKSFLPRKLPALPPARFAVKFSSCQAVGGDFYDVIRLDERRIGFYVADAMGHGVPAALLTIFVKKGIVTKEIAQDSYRILAPGEVLDRLNRDLIAHDVSENPFITMAYLVLDLDRLAFACARAGHPYPLLLKPTGTMTPIKAGGIMLGIAEAEYPTVEQSLAPGDRVVLYTDGIDSVSYAGRPQGLASFETCLADLHGRPIDQFVDDVYQALFPAGVQDDDFTLLVLEVAG